MKSRKFYEIDNERIIAYDSTDEVEKIIIEKTDKASIILYLLNKCNGLYMKFKR
jgi:hypothetical protein